MFGFDGNYQNKRQINLGGKKTLEDKEGLLKSAQDQRKEREAKRLRLKSATKIQAFYRGRKIAGNLHNVERTSWDQQAQTFFNGDGGNWDAETASALVNLVRSFLFFYQPQQDSHRKLCLCQILSRPRHNSHTIFLPFFSDEFREIWKHQLGRTLVIFLESIGSSSIRPGENLSIVDYLKVLQLAVSVASEKWGGLIDGRIIATSITENLVKHGLYNKLRKLLVDLPEGNKNSPTSVLIADLLINPVQSLRNTPAQGSAVQDFTIEILTIPLLQNRITISHIAIEAVLIKLSKMSIDEFSIEEKSALLGNVLVYTSAKVATMGSNYMLSYLKVVQKLSSKIPSAIDEDDEEEDEEENEEDEDVIMHHSQAITEAVRIDPQVRQSIDILFEKRHLGFILSFAYRTDSASLLKVANYLVTLMIRWPSRKEHLLKVMSWAPFLKQSDHRSAVDVIWKAFKNTDLFQKIKQKFSYSIVTRDSFAEEWGMLVLLCELFSKILLTTGDDEFFEEEKSPLKLQDVIEMSICLRNVAFTLYWNYTSLKMEDIIEGGCITIGLIRDVVTESIRRIHERDSRRQFTPPNHWLMISELNMVGFIEAVVREQESETNGPAEKQNSSSASPRLAILNNIPFVIPFEERVKVFRKFIEIDRGRIFHNDFFSERRPRATIRRTHVFEDGYTYLNGLGKDLKRQVAIQFTDEYGIPEDGIDGGGLFKEFLTALTRQAFDMNYGLFLSTKDQLLYPNPHYYARQEQQLSYYEFLGRILGKALYEGILVDVAFAGFFLSKWLGRLSYLDDLPSLDPELYQGLIFLKNYQGNVETDLSLNFTVVDEDFGESRTIDLIPRGADTPVTEENRISYVYRMANYRLNRQIERQCTAFFRGLRDLIDKKWLQMFNQQELQILIGGVYTLIDLEDLRRNTVYAGYEESDVVIQNFWSVVERFTEEQKQRLVKFVTSCSRPPLLGFKELNPKFTIRIAGTELRLPTSSTCVNLLKLPAYPDEKTMREKLEYAISVEVGFGLS